MSNNLPPAHGGGGGGGNTSHRKPCCSAGWEQRATFYVVLLGVLAFLGLLIGIISKGEDLDQTSKATVSMHKETIEMRTSVEKALSTFRSHFPANQETITTEQVLDTIDKVHSIIVWAEEVRRGLPPDTLQTIVKNAGTLVGNVTAFVDTIGAIFGPSSGSEKESVQKRAMIANAGTFFSKGAELLNTVSPEEFHSAFVASHEAVQTFSRMSRGLADDRVNSIVQSMSDILSAADSTHIVSVIAKLTEGVTQVINRFTSPQGIRLSLPLDMGAAPLQDRPGTASPSLPVVKR